MVTEQKVAELEAELGKLKAAEDTRFVATTVAGELARYELASPAAAEQLQQLITPSVGITKLDDGRQMVFRKSDFTPLSSLVRETLARPEYAHFLKPKGSTAPGQAATPATRPIAAAVPAQSAVREILPGETYGTAIVRVATAKRAEQGDPRLDPSQPFGLRPRALLPK